MAEKSYANVTGKNNDLAANMPMLMHPERTMNLLAIPPFIVEFLMKTSI